MVEEIRIGDVVTTRKPHPCGGNEWTVTRTGADIKIRCNVCGRVVMMDREDFLRRRKAVLRQGPLPAAGPGITPDRNDLSLSPYAEDLVKAGE